MKIEEIVTEQELVDVWGNARFGDRFTKRDVVKNTLLKCASGYHSGFTVKSIVTELGLVTSKWKLTKKGQQYLWESFSNNISI